MLLPSVRLIFNRKCIASATKAAAVQVEITHQRKRRYYDTGVRLFEGQWNPSSRVIKRMDALELNRRLNEIECAIQSYITEVARNGGQFSWNGVAAIFGRKQGLSFIEFVRKRVAERSDIRESTRRTQGKLVDSLRAFGRIVEFADVTRANIMAYDTWLHGKAYCQSTVHSYHKFLKTYINDAIRRELLSQNPYAGIRISRGAQGHRKFLTSDELTSLSATTLSSEHLEHARDLFVFQCYTFVALTNGYLIINKLQTNNRGIGNGLETTCLHHFA